MIGQYECCKCGVRFKWQNGPTGPNPCCGSLYRKWLDYEKQKANGFKESK